MPKGLDNGKIMIVLLGTIVRALVCTYAFE